MSFGYVNNTRTKDIMFDIVERAIHTMQYWEGVCLMPSKL